MWAERRPNCVFVSSGMSAEGDPPASGELVRRGVKCRMLHVFVDEGDLSGDRG